jgi:hypothetical protein
MGQIRHLLLYRHKNGLQEAVRRIGKRLMFRLDLFEQWIKGKRRCVVSKRVGNKKGAAPWTASAPSKNACSYFASVTDRLQESNCMEGV